MLKDNPQLPLKMSTDTGYQQQPEGSYPFALNAVNNYEDGNRGSLVNEQGNYEFAELPGNYCGHITINRYEFIVFTDDGSITLLNTQRGDKIILITLPEFEFSTSNIITGEYRVVRGCENVIYWRDGVNPDRYFNYSKPNDFQVNGVFDVNQFSFIKNFKHPIIDTEVVSTGGNTDYGSYFFCIEYVDNRGNTLFTSPLSIKYTVISGGYNIDNYQPEVGGKPKSDSSINLRIENLSTDYEFIRINAVIYRSGNGVSYFAHAVGSLIPISDEIINYTYIGYNPDAGDYQIDANSLLVEKSIYTSSMVMEQVDGRMIRGNLVESYRNYASYQQYASKICTNYIIEQDTEGCRTELGGEVKAYGIVYIFEDGTTSPVFHIPGPRNINNIGNGTKAIVIYALQLQGIPCNEEAYYELTYTLNGETRTISGYAKGRTPVLSYDGILTVDNFIAKSECLLSTTYAIEDNLIPVDPERSIESNAFRVGFDGDFYGVMGDYQTSQLYNNPKNYCGDDFWGVDCNGVSLLNTNIRYHYLPDRSIEPLGYSTTGGETYNKIGVRFGNIQYPEANIVGHYFVSNIRTPQNSLIVDKGIFFQWHMGENNKIGRIIDYDQPQQITDIYGFISPESTFGDKYLRGNYFTVEHNIQYSSKVDNSSDIKEFFTGDNDNLALYRKDYVINTYLPAEREIVKVTNSYALSPKTKVNNTEIENHSFSSKFLALSTESVSFKNNTRIFFGSLKRQINAFPDIQSILYRRITEINENRSFNGDGFISKHDLTNISWFSVRNRWIPRDVKKYEYEYIKNVVCESVINTSLRHQGESLCNTYFDGNDIEEWFYDKISQVIDGKVYLRQSECPEWYGYNKDMSIINVLNKNFPLPLLWDYCSACTNKYPNRIIFSQKSLSEQLEDNYLTTLANDYVDIPGDTGEITGIDYKDGKLLVRTTYSSYFLQPNPQQLSTNESTVYIGTGEFLSIPALEINAEQTGYGGQQHILESINTEHGFIWIDRQKGKVFKFANGLEEISRYGMQYWFMRNLPGDNHCVLTYDAQYERVIITKQNEWSISYDFLNKAWTSFHSYIPQNYMYDGDTFYSVIDTKVWRHKGSNTFCKFFDVEKPYVVEFVVRDFMNFDMYSIQYYATPYIYNGSEWVKDPSQVFNGMWVYNDFQSTGYVTLELDRGYDNIYFYINKKHVKESDGMYKVSNIKAANRNSQVSTGDYPNKEPMPVEITSQYDLVPMSNRFAVVRLYLTNSSTKMITHLLNTIKQYNIR